MSMRCPYLGVFYFTYEYFDINIGYIRKEHVYPATKCIPKNHVVLKMYFLHDSICGCFPKDSPPSSFYCISQLNMPSQTTKLVLNNSIQICCYQFSLSNGNNATWVHPFNSMCVAWKQETQRLRIAYFLHVFADVAYNTQICKTRETRNLPIRLFACQNFYDFSLYWNYHCHKKQF